MISPLEAVLARLNSMKIAVYLRSSIDDHNATVVAAGIDALHSLLISPNGESVPPWSIF